MISWRMYRLIFIFIVTQPAVHVENNFKIVATCFFFLQDVKKRLWCAVSPGSMSEFILHSVVWQVYSLE